MGAVNIAVVLDEPGHLRLPIVDDEIVSRAVALRSATGLSVRLASYDKTGFTLRARSENFDCEAPTIPPPPSEPAGKM